MEMDKIYQGDSLEVLKTLEENTIDCCVTSPPYYALRDYGVDGQIGLEETPEKYIERLTNVFKEVHRVLKPNGTMWLNIGDSYAGNCSVTSTGRCGMGKPRERIDHRVFDGIKPKDLIGIPWMLAFSLRNAGWYLRQDIIWHKPNPMPESVTDRCTKSHEYIFLMSKSQKYYFDYEAIQEEAVTQADRRIGKRVTYDGKHKGEEGTGNRAFVSLRTKNCQYDGQKPNTMHLKRENGGGQMKCMLSVTNVMFGA